MATNVRPSKVNHGVFLFIAILLLACEPQHVEASNRSQYKPFMLKYYVHIQIGSVNLNTNFVPPLNTSSSANFGAGVLFALNATKGLDTKSKQLGYSRGYTIETSYFTGISRGVETTVLEYNDGRRHNGTFVIMGIVGTLSLNEVAIVGGTGTFQGANGYAFISFIREAPNNVYTFHHQAHFI